MPRDTVDPDAKLRSVLAQMAPGTALRDGLQRILRGNTGALIVLGNDKTVNAISAGARRIARFAGDDDRDAKLLGLRRHVLREVCWHQKARDVALSVLKPSARRRAMEPEGPPDSAAAQSAPPLVLLAAGVA